MRPLKIGSGLGFRSEYENEIFNSDHSVEWFEIISDNYINKSGNAKSVLDKLRERYPVAMHGVAMSLGSTDELDISYVNSIKSLSDRIDPLWISDHLAWTGVGGNHFSDLYPLPYHDESLKHVTKRIQAIQDIIGRQLLIENPSSYLVFKDSCIDEATFLKELTAAADCLILLDINNVYVSAHNNGFDPTEYLNTIPADRVIQMHIAGHKRKNNFFIDTHDQPISQDVWELFSLASRLFPNASPCLERDANFPSFDEIISEFNLMHAINNKCLSYE